ncbi:unnamed protein product [Callosobruchus maculatus]|uniref:Cytochrome c oxidase copper chaperone COX17 n=1 Tax=Callosobruchus maculatus TaxID=64391 RepID=A0A653BU17_CALMS|nr:unnamed protein product [Callosobruchus maculatus]
MGNISEKVDAASTSPQSQNAEQPKKLKPCCACPETKRARDAWYYRKGEEHCGDLIEAHKQCMRDAGFTYKKKLLHLTSQNVFNFINSS